MKEDVVAWGGSWVVQLLAVREWRPEFGSTVPTQKPGVAMYVHILHIWEAEIGRSLELVGRPIKMNWLILVSERPSLKSSWGGDWERHQMPASGLTQELTHTYTNHRCTHGCESRCGPIPAFGKRKKGDQEFKARWCYLAILGASLSYIRSCLQTKKEQNKNEDVAEYGGLYVLSTRVAKACWSQVWGQPGLYRQTVS